MRMLRWISGKTRWDRIRNDTIRESGVAPIRETIRKDLEVNELDPNMVYDITLWRNLIYVADPT